MSHLSHLVFAISVMLLMLPQYNMYWGEGESMMFVIYTGNIANILTKWHQHERCAQKCCNMRMPQHVLENHCFAMQKNVSMHAHVSVFLAHCYCCYLYHQHSHLHHYCCCCLQCLLLAPSLLLLLVPLLLLLLCCCHCHSCCCCLCHRCCPCFSAAVIVFLCQNGP